MSGFGHYVLDGHTPRREDDVIAWGRWFESAERRVARSEFNDVEVSTVFLGLDHSFIPNTEPILFETMVFGGEHDGYCDRYHTWDEAVAGHAAVVQMVHPLPRRGIDLDGSHV